MSAHFPDHETVYTALSLATRAPSVHNTQPWRWRVGSDSLHLYTERGLNLPSTDPDGRDLILSCGIALHHCVVALAALGEVGGAPFAALYAGSKKAELAQSCERLARRPGALGGGHRCWRVAGHLLR